MIREKDYPDIRGADPDPRITREIRKSLGLEGRIGDVDASVINRALDLLKTIETGEYISKKETLGLLNDLYKLGIPIEPRDYRSLSSRKMYGVLRRTKVALELQATRYGISRSH